MRDTRGSPVRLWETQGRSKSLERWELVEVKSGRRPLGRGEDKMDSSRSLQRGSVLQTP